MSVHSWVLNFEDKMCEGGKEFHLEYKDKDPKLYWKTIRDAETYLFLANIDPQTVIQLLMRCIEEFQPDKHLPGPLARAKTVVTNKEASKEEMEQQLKSTKKEEERTTKTRHKYYYEAIGHLLRWRLGLTRPMIYIKILRALSTSIKLTRRYPRPTKKLFINFLKKELPYEEWKALRENAEIPEKE